jgi:hypothetical protein
LQTEKSSLLLKVQELEEKLLETQLQLERVTDEKLTRMLSIQKSPNDKTGLGYVASSSDVPSSSKTVFVKPTVQSFLPLLKINRRKRLMMMFQALSSLIPLEDLLFTITEVSVGMFGLSASSLKLKRPKPRKKRPDKLIMVLDLHLSIRLCGIRHPIKYHGDKHQGISIKPLGLMLLSLSGLSSGSYQPITVALTRAILR